MVLHDTRYRSGFLLICMFIAEDGGKTIELSSADLAERRTVDFLFRSFMGDGYAEVYEPILRSIIVQKTETIYEHDSD